jgi:diguanylate cyclase (GGDEF)-like protein
MKDKVIQELKYFAEIVESIFSTVELQRVLNVIAQKATAVLDADASAILLVDPEEGEMRIRASYNLSPEYVEVVRLRVGEELSGKVVEDGEAVYIPDAIEYFRKKKDKFSLKWIKKEGLVSAISLPISGRQGISGTLNIYYRRSHSFTGEEKEIISLFASFANVAISNAASFEERQREIRALEALNLIGQKISSVSDFESLVEVVYGETSKIMKTENFYLALYNVDANEIRFILYVEEGKRRSRSRRVLRRGLTEYVVRTQNPLLVRNNVVAEAEKLGIEALGRPAQCWMGVPILYGKKVLGVIAVQDYKKMNVYDEADMRVLQTIANQTAVAIENSRLYEETRKMAVTDPMTGLYNIRHLYNVLQLEIERAKRYGLRFSLLIIDIDNFKAYNDKYGHLLGDELLIRYGKFLIDNSRTVDTVCRYGGDEFVIILPQTAKEDVGSVNERIKKKLKRHRFKIDSKKIALMVTIGDSSFPEDGSTSEDLIRIADRDLLERKRKKEKDKL